MNHSHNRPHFTGVSQEIFDRALLDIPDIPNLDAKIVTATHNFVVGSPQCLEDDAWEIIFEKFFGQSIVEIERNTGNHPKHNINKLNSVEISPQTAHVRSKK